MVVLGKIVDSYGLRGAIKVHPFADDPLAWGKLPNWWIGQEGSAGVLAWQASRLIRCRLQNTTLIAELECLSDCNASEAVRGYLVGVPRNLLPPTAAGEYYWSDLIGLDVFNQQNECLGQVLGLIETPANNVLRVGRVEQDAHKQAERLLPFVATVVLEVDLPARRMRVAWAAGWSL